ncbi:MAG TPA: DHH family phosphoesterase [Kofleriaceae bacterium]|nr:DHH family phosphoesterase [Kofleriaceae bacterium]
MTNELERAAEILATADKVMVTCHLGPDGDAVGSMVAMSSLLRQRGAQVTMYNPDLVPRHLKWMPLCKGLAHRLPRSASFAATVVMDCGDAKLLGPDFPPPEVTGKLIVIDHHASGRPFGDVFVCDPDAASVGVLVARLARHLDWPITDEAAIALYVSLVTDTGSFRYANTNAEALRLAADLVERHGVGPWAVSERLSEQGTLARYRLLAAALATLQPVLGGHVVFMTITEVMVKAAEAAWEDSEGMVNYARSIRGVECGVLITPAKRGGVRVSMRSKGHIIDAGAICLSLGGGGHRGAAGCTLPGDLASARATVEAALSAALIAGGVVLDAAS